MQKPVSAGFCVVGGGRRSARSQNLGHSPRENLDYNNSKVANPQGSHIRFQEQF
jgi:hypothetical protein